MVLVRALPRGKDMDSAVALMKEVKAYRLGSDPDASPTTWVDLTHQAGLDFTPVRWETGIDYWRVLHEILQADVLSPDYSYQYGELAELGIRKGTAFDPDARMTGILEQASLMGHAQLAVESFADRRPERTVWPGTHWEWAVLQPDSGTFDTGDYVDLYAREKWFYQAQIESPAMFARAPGAGSLYWLGLRDSGGDYLTGDNSYTLDVPQPVPASLFWSVTVYDAETRSEILTEQNKAALRSLFELSDVATDRPVTLYFGPNEPEDAAAAARWIQTKPDTGWFVYFRIYGPTDAAFDGRWRLPDFRRA